MAVYALINNILISIDIAVKPPYVYRCTEVSHWPQSANTNTRRNDNSINGYFFPYISILFPSTLVRFMSFITEG